MLNITKYLYCIVSKTKLLAFKILKNKKKAFIVNLSNIGIYEIKF